MLQAVAIVICCAVNILQKLDLFEICGAFLCGNQKLAHFLCLNACFLLVHHSLESFMIMGEPPTVS
jgi:hypothetical protein